MKADTAYTCNIKKQANNACNIKGARVPRHFSARPNPMRIVIMLLSRSESSSNIYYKIRLLYTALGTINIDGRTGAY